MKLKNKKIMMMALCAGVIGSGQCMEQQKAPQNNLAPMKDDEMQSIFNNVKQEVQKLLQDKEFVASIKSMSPGQAGNVAGKQEQQIPQERDSALDDFEKFIEEDPSAEISTEEQQVQMPSDKQVSEASMAEALKVFEQFAQQSEESQEATKPSCFSKKKLMVLGTGLLSFISLSVLSRLSSCKSYNTVKCAASFWKK